MRPGRAQRVTVGDSWGVEAGLAGRAQDHVGDAGEEGSPVAGRRTRHRLALPGLRRCCQTILPFAAGSRRGRGPISGRPVVAAVRPRGRPGSASCRWRSPGQRAGQLAGRGRSSPPRQQPSMPVVAGQHLRLPDNSTCCDIHGHHESSRRGNLGVGAGGADVDQAPLHPRWADQMAARRAPICPSRLTLKGLGSPLSCRSSTAPCRSTSRATTEPRNLQHSQLAVLREGLDAEEIGTGATAIDRGAPVIRRPWPLSMRAFQELAGVGVERRNLLVSRNRTGRSGPGRPSAGPRGDAGARGGLGDGASNAPVPCSAGRPRPTRGDVEPLAQDRGLAAFEPG